MMVIYVFQCSSNQEEYCERCLIKREDGLDPQVVLEEAGMAECWKCGAELEFVEKR